MSKARKLSSSVKPDKADKVDKHPPVTFGVCATCDPRLDAASRSRAANVVSMVAEVIAENVRMPSGAPAEAVWTNVLIDGEKQADTVASQFRNAGVHAVVVAPDTWAFPQLTLISLLSQLPADVPVNITCGNSGRKPSQEPPRPLGRAPSSCRSSPR